MIPVVLLVGLLSYCITVFGDGMLSGPSQLVLTLCTGVVVAISMLVYKQSWQSLENAMVVGISRSMSANLILLMVGGLCGTWMHSGIIPTMIYYGLEVISARWLLLTSCVLCALVSLCIGSSWTTIATIGVGLMGIGRTLGLEDGWVAGAIISGAYFGDKMSPLSETTNLASSISDVPLFTHIKNLLHTTVPTLLITLVAFTVVGLSGGGGADIDTNAAVEMQHHLNATFPITMWLLLLPLLVFFLIYKGMAATMVLFIGMLLGGIIVCFTQGFDFAIECAFGEVGYTTGVDTIDSLTSTRGMGGMLYAEGHQGTNECSGHHLHVEPLPECHDGRPDHLDHPAKQDVWFSLRPVETTTQTDEPFPRGRWYGDFGARAVELVRYDTIDGAWRGDNHLCSLYAVLLDFAPDVGHRRIRQAVYHEEGGSGK